MSSTYTLRIEAMAFKGYGVGRMDRKVVFVPYTATGDLLSVEILKEKKDYCFGRAVEIVEPSSWRADPRCPYFGRCGGCHLQHIDPMLHPSIKKTILREMLERISGLRRYPDIETISADGIYDYRIRVQLKATDEGIGYFEGGSHRIVDIQHCHIAHPLVNEIIGLIRKEKNIFSNIGQIEITVSPDEKCGIILLQIPVLSLNLKNLLDHFLKRNPAIKGIAVRERGGLRVLGEKHISLTASFKYLGDRKSLKLRVSPESFVQAHPRMNSQLIETVLLFGNPEKHQTAIDLYCGTGNLTLPLAFYADRVFGIDGNLTAVEDARFNATLNCLGQCNFVAGKVEDVFENLSLNKADLIVLDPPRIGSGTAIERITGLSPERIVYVSCNPPTLARDLRLLEGKGYKLKKICLIDLFPQTYHMEVVSLLVSGQKG